jgi:hypothetical protein
MLAEANSPINRMRVPVPHTNITQINPGAFSNPGNAGYDPSPPDRPQERDRSWRPSTTRRQPAS